MSSSAMPAYPGGESSPQLGAIALNLSLKGQHIQSFRFEQRVITVGRDPNCDVYVDNPGVSRHHFQIEWAQTGEFRVVDGGSANGTFLNEKPVRTATLRTGDAIQFAKYSLEVTVEELVGDAGHGQKLHDRSSEGATVMLSPSQVRQIVSESRGNTVPVPGRVVPMPATRVAAAPVAKSAPSRVWLPWAIVVAAVAAVTAVAVWWATK
jgi:pSer/pThr/pTyr-binding forkhead associated (FHA) protein